MNIVARHFCPGVLAATLLCGVSLTCADPAVYTFSAVQPETRAEWSHDFAFPLFDPSWGALDAVRITARYDISTSGSVLNTHHSSKVFWFQAGSLFSLSLPGTLGTLQLSPFADDVHYKLPGFGSATYGAYSTNGFTQLTLTGSDTAAFIGSGTLHMGAVTSTETRVKEIINGGGNKIEFTLDTFAGAVVTLEYLGRPVPEPSSATLLAAAAGLLLLRRRPSAR